jgi:NodT family efflux transporter outer membrane factor (OMF) lipoprotein
VGPKYRPPDRPTPTAKNYKESTVNFQDTEGWKVASPQGEMLPGNWWEIFNDAGLNALEEQLNINNQTIKQYFEAYMEARALVAEAHSQYWPTVTTTASYNQAKSSSTLFHSSQANVGLTSTLYSLAGDASWIPDLFGRIRNTVREYQSGAQVSAADLELERLTEQASLASYYYEIRGQDALQKILNDTVKADQEALKLTEVLYKTGVDGYISVVEARATLEAARAAAIEVGVARAQYEHAIAVLLGKVPTDFHIPARPSLTSPPPIPVGVPAELLERRPDIAGAERTLAEDNAIIGVGYAAFFPTVTLSADGGLQSSSVQNWFSWPSRFWSVGPAAAETVYNGGLYRAQIHQYTATYNKDLATYRNTVLTAFQQVEDYLAEVRIESQQVIHQQEAVEAAQEFLKLEMVRYRTGVDPYIDVVTAQTTLLTNQQAAATAQISAMAAAVNLIEALGGGWDRSQLPSPKQVSKTPAQDYKLQH